MRVPSYEQRAPRRCIGNGYLEHVVYRCWAPTERAWFWRHISSRAAENHRGHGEALIVPSLKAPAGGEHAQIHGGVTQALHAALVSSCRVVQ